MTKTITIDSIHKIPSTPEKLENLEPLRIKLIGSQFNGGLTYSVMKGLVDLQEGINRSYCIAQYGDSNLRRLTNDEIKQLELIVTLEKGSTDIIGNLAELTSNLNKLLKDMSPTQKTYIIMAIIFGVMGYFAWDRWLEHEKHINDNQTKIALEQERTKQLDSAQKNVIEAFKLGQEQASSPSSEKEEQKKEGQNQENNQPATKEKQTPEAEHFKLSSSPPKAMKMISELRTKQPQISETMEQAQSKFVRSMKFADKVVYHNVFEASGNVLEKITEKSKSTWTDTVITDDFRVLDIDSTHIDYRSVKLRTSNGIEFTAKFTDKSISKTKFNLLAKAMYGYNPINLSVRTKSLNGKFKDGIIDQVRKINSSQSFKEDKA